MSIISPIFSREIRLGLVLYGGVSLAIYMNGVCQEFYNAVRGRGIYKLIKALTDSDIVIDIVSGTSAGGVNGILLSYAIANSSHDVFVDFKDLATLWKDYADVNELLLKKHCNKTINSVFDGELYKEKLEEAFTDKIKHHPEDELYSDFSELDLFITATDLAGRIHKVSDNTGRIIEVKDHRTVFHLKYRQEQANFIDNPFKPGDDTQKALAKLCRITSCFPVAFPTVEVNIDLKDELPSEDRKLIEWGKLREREGEKNKLFFVDGGVLSNRPFSSTIQAIYGRTAYRPVERKLFYVDPDPERFLDKESSTSPSPRLVAMKSKIDIPNYQSISKDIESIKEGNRKVIRQKLLKDSLDMNWDEIINSYPNFKITESIDKTEVVNYLKCRFLSLLDNSIDEILKTSFEQADNKESFIEKLSDLLNTKDVLVGEEFVKLYLQIRPWDIEFMIRKHSFLLEVTSKKIQEVQENHIKQYLVLRYIAYQLSWQLELLRIIQRAIHQILNGYELNEIPGIKDTGDKGIESLYEFLENVYETLLKINGDKTLDTYYELTKIIHFPDDINFNAVSWSDLNILIPERESSERKKEIFAKIYQMPICQVLLKPNEEKGKYINEKVKPQIEQNIPNSNESQSLLKTIDDHSMVMINKASAYFEGLRLKEFSEAYFEGLRLKEFSEKYELIDMMLYPYEYLSDIVTKTPIQIVRVSPNDDEDEEKGLGYGKGKDIDQKLKGYKCFAFGGFFNKAWRTNDILWGRLDGLSRIVEALVTPTSINNFKEFIRKHPQDTWKDLIPEGKGKEDIITDLKTFIDDPNHLDGDNFKGFLNKLVTLGQWQILDQDLDEKSKLKSQGNLRDALEGLGKQKSINALGWFSWARIIWIWLRIVIQK